MTAQIISIKGTWPDEMQAGFIEKLEEYIAMARKGKLKALALCAVASDDMLLTSVCASDDRHALLGGIVHLQHDLINSLD